MANPEHFEILKQGVDVWNKWREESPEIKPDLRKANLSWKNLAHINFSETDLYNANLSRTDLHNANLSQANLGRTDFYGTNLSQADLSNAFLLWSNLAVANLLEANLSNANLNRAFLIQAFLVKANINRANLQQATLIMANLSNANLSYATLWGADIRDALLEETDLRDADLEGANLSGAILKKTNLDGCRIHAISAWKVHLEDTLQTNLIITEEKEPIITVDSLEVAQFIYLLLHNEKIRQVINTITSKVVLIFGRFTPERKQVLATLRDKLRDNNYSPIVFDFEDYNSESFTETARTLANMAHFVLVDLTDLDDAVQKELATSIIPRCVVPIQPFLLGNRRYNQAIFRDPQQNCSWFLPLHRYKDTSDLLTVFQEQIIQPAEEKTTELKQRKPLKLFFGYAHEDKEMLDTLKKHLRPLERSGQIEMWDDRDVEPGNTTNEEIEKQLSDARIILLLMSPDFIASNGCYVIQERAMEFYEQGKAKVIPVLLRKCGWKSTPLGQLQVLPRDERPMKDHDLDELFFEVSEEISDVIKEMM